MTKHVLFGVTLIVNISLMLLCLYLLIEGVPFFYKQGNGFLAGMCIGLGVSWFVALTYITIHKYRLYRTSKNNDQLV